MVLRRDETEPARALFLASAGRLGSLERSEHGVAVDGFGGRRAARLAEVRERCELRVKRRVRARSGRSRRCAKSYSPRWQERMQRSTSASRRFLFKLSRRASSNAGHAHFVLAAQQRAHRGRVQLGIAELVEHIGDAHYSTLPTQQITKKEEQIN
jgi:hypothetical protein